MRLSRLTALLLIPLLVSCSSSYRQRRPFLVKENLANANRHYAEGNEEEAAQIYKLVVVADPRNEKAQQRLDSLGGCEQCLLMPTVLGQNRVDYPESESSTLWLVAYPVNRVLDITDIVSFYVGPRGGLYFDVHATHALRTAAGAGGGPAIGWWQKRELAAGSGHVAGFGIMPFSAETGNWSNLNFSQALQNGMDIRWSRDRRVVLAAVCRPVCL